MQHLLFFFFRGISNLTSAAEDIFDECDGAQSLEYTVLLYLATGNWSDCEYDYANCTAGLYLGTQTREVACIDQVTNETSVDCNDDLLPASSRVPFLFAFFLSIQLFVAYRNISARTSVNLLGLVQCFTSKRFCQKKLFREHFLIR